MSKTADTLQFRYLQWAVYMGQVDAGTVQALGLGVAPVAPEPVTEPVPAGREPMRARTPDSMRFKGAGGSA
ncbi:MAG: hypothetical protein V1724_08935 [Chloroflexota bacterium]